MARGDARARSSAPVSSSPSSDSDRNCAGHGAGPCLSVSDAAVSGASTGHRPAASPACEPAVNLEMS